MSSPFGIMNAEYKFRCDEHFVAESLRRYRQHHPARLLRWTLKGIGFVGLGFLAALGIFANSPPLVGIFVFFIVLLIAGTLIDAWWVRRRFRKSPSYNADVSARFSNAGYFGEDANSRVELSWAVFTDGARLSDGFILFTGPHIFYWFPDRALVAGDIREIELVFKQNLSKFKSAEQTVAADRRSG